MNEEQTKLYEEWKRLEASTRVVAKVGGVQKEYSAPAIQPNDILNLGPVREKVWSNLKNFLTEDEKVNLGFDLDKSPEEIFNIKKDN